MLDLSAYKPVVGTPGDAAQVANGFTAVETYVNGDFDPAGIDQDGATVGQVMMWDGTEWKPASLPASAVSVFTVAPFTLASSVTLTSIADQTIPGGTLGSTKKLRCEFVGDWLNNAASASTVQAQIVWGGTTIFDFTTSAPTTSATRGLWWLTFLLFASVDTGHQGLSHGDFRVNQGSAATVGIKELNPVGTRFAGSNPYAIDSTVDQHLVVKAKLSQNHANTNIRMLHGSIEVIG